MPWIQSTERLVSVTTYSSHIQITLTTPDLLLILGPITGKAEGDYCDLNKGLLYKFLGKCFLPLATNRDSVSLSTTGYEQGSILV